MSSLQPVPAFTLEPLGLLGTSLRPRRSVLYLLNSRNLVLNVLERCYVLEADIPKRFNRTYISKSSFRIFEPTVIDSGFFDPFALPSR
jgi:hypothetical protein